MTHILIVDDEPRIVESLEMFMSEKGLSVLTAHTLADGLALFRARRPGIVILDIRLPDGSGLDALKEITALDPGAKVIMITAFQDMESTILAMKRGAFDYIHKPLDADEIEKAVDDAVFQIRAGKTGKKECNAPSASQVIVGKSRQMNLIFKSIGLLCQNRATALIQGETGTGKELIARQIHQASPACDRPFVTFDCSAVVDTLLESELFGHEKGAFTGAHLSKPGKLELAGNGTLFLDEIGELPLNLQGKFLGFLERKEYMRVGGSRVFKSKCRIIAATNQDLEQMAADKRFRQDLYYRLKVVTVQVPPLRERQSDIPALAAHFLDKTARDHHTRVCRLQDGCIRHLQSYPWPGNVRELENALVAAAVRARGRVIPLTDIQRLLSGRQERQERPQPPGLCPLWEVEKQHIRHVLESVGWNRTRAVEILRISLPTLRKKIRDYQLAPR
ncbi:MAG: sigma-54 dependent transcriptional regulator [Desulfobacterales bacterium]|nr:sigma-54 dependent transcriptional regulator [Desulfobacterales bacterium]